MDEVLTDNINNQQDNIKISVVMPAYNHQKFINETIDSVLNQSFQNLELIIIDDGSKDNTGKICQSYNDPRLKYHYQDNQDAFNAINNGMKLAGGEYITIINSDDVYKLQRLERIMQVVEEQGALCVFSEIELINDDSEIIDSETHFWRQWHDKNRAFYKEYGDLYSTFLNGNIMVTTSNLFMHRSVYETIGGFKDYRYLHDYDYIFRILQQFESQTVYLENERLMQYRLHGGNTISQAAIIGREQDKEIIRAAVLNKFDSQHHKYLNVGINRLIQLEHELIQAHKEIEQTKHAQLESENAAKEPKTRLDFYKLHIKNALHKLAQSKVLN